MKLAEEFGDDLAIVLVESQGAGPKKAEAFAWKRKWMGTQAMWTCESPFDTGTRGLPKFALLSASGEVLMKGNPLAMHGKIKDAIEEEIDLAKEAPDGTPKSLTKSWKTFAKGNYTKALQEARKVEAKGGEDVKAAAQMVAQFVSKIEAQFARIDWLMEAGYVTKAQEQVKTIAKRTKGLDDFAEYNSKWVERLASEDLKSELDAAKAFAKIEGKLMEKGLDDKLIKKLSKFVDKHGESSVGKRAKHILTLTE